MLAIYLITFKAGIEEVIFVVLFVGWIAFGIYSDLKKEFKEPKKGNKIPFPFPFFYNKKSLSKAYLALGIAMVRKETFDRRAQLVYLARYLKQKFPHNKRLNIREVMRYYDFDYDEYTVLEWLNKKMPPQNRIQILDFMANLAFYNQRLSKGEMALLESVAKKLKIDQESFDAIMAIRMEQYEQFHQTKKEQEQQKKQRKPSLSQRKKALKILGLSGNPSPDEIKKKYRQLAKKFHPDKFVKMGEDELKMANERFAVINDAYDCLG